MLTTLRHWVVPHPGNAYHPRALHHGTLFSVTVGLIAAKLLVAGALLASFPTPASFSSFTAARVLSLTNAARAKQGLPPLKLNDRLTRGAAAKARDMLQHQYFDHVSPNGTTSWYWFTGFGYRYAAAGENLATGFDSSEELVAAWLDSPAHAANNLGEEYQDTGIAIVSGTLFGEKTTVAVELFALPKEEPVAAAPTVAPTPPPAELSEPAVSLPPPEPVRVATGPTVERSIPWTRVHGAAMLVPAGASQPSGALRFAAGALPTVIGVVAAGAALLLGTTLVVHAHRRHVPVVLHVLVLLAVGAALLEVNFHFLQGVLTSPVVALR